MRASTNSEAHVAHLATARRFFGSLVFSPVSIVVLLAVAFLPLQAQSTNPPVAVAIAPVTNLLQMLGGSQTDQQLASDALSVFVDAVPYISNDIVQVDAAVMYNHSLAKGRFGAFLGIDIPTTQQMSVGFGGAYFNHQFYDATINLKLGSTFNLPWIGKAYGYLASGPDYNFSKKAVGAYDFLGVFKTWDVFHFANGNGLDLSLGAAFGNISTISGLTMMGTIAANYHY